MDPIEKKALDFLIGLGRVINGMQMYDENHPIVKNGLINTQKILEPILGTLSTLSFGKGDGVLLIQNKKITERNAIAERFVEDMTERHIGGVVIRRGTPVTELQAFVKIMSTKPDQVVVDGEIRPELLRPFNKISINEIKYLMVNEDEDLESLTEARRFFNTIFDEEFKNLKGAEALRRLGEIIKKIMPKLTEMGFENSDEELWEFFERSVESFGGGDVGTTHSSLMTTIQTMDLETQKKLFGETIRSEQQLIEILQNFSDDRKAGMIAQESESKGEIGGALNTLLQDRGEVVHIIESLARKFNSGSEEDQQKFSKIFAMIHELDGGSRSGKNRGAAIIIDAEEEYIEKYRDLLTRLGFTVEVITSGKEALQHLQNNEKPELIVMDLKLPELSGLEILSFLELSRKHVPILICTELVAMKDSFEVVVYPKQKFIKKPGEGEPSLSMEVVLSAIDVLCPPPKEDSPSQNTAGPEGAIQAHMSAELEAELEKAKEIQRNLLPLDLPEMPGYEVFAFYKAYDQIGGDYYDIFPIGEDHIGMLIADVSGHGITGAMVMVMVRSAVRTWAHTTISPKEMLSKINPIVSRDILPGFFCTVYYAVLDMPNRKLVATCAGHNPALLWRAKTRECIFTKTGGMPLGIVSGASFENSLQEEEIPLEEGDRLVFYTDGFVETMNPEQEEYGEDRFCEVIKESASQRSDVCLKYCLLDLFDHQSTAPQHDDLTIMTMKVLKMDQNPKMEQ